MVNGKLYQSGSNEDEDGDDGDIAQMYINSIIDISPIITS